jgi:hypothetical protein
MMASNPFALLPLASPLHIKGCNKQLASPRHKEIAKLEAPQTMCGQMVSSHLAAALLLGSLVPGSVPRSTDVKWRRIA